MPSGGCRRSHSTVRASAAAIVVVAFQPSSRRMRLVSVTRASSRSPLPDRGPRGPVPAHPPPPRARPLRPPPPVPADSLPDGPDPLLFGQRLLLADVVANVLLPVPQGQFDEKQARRENARPARLAGRYRGNPGEESKNHLLDRASRLRRS